MRDFLSKEAERMRHVEQVSRELAHLYGYEEAITPVVESYDLLAAKAGKEIRERMYTFKDLGGRKVALRPNTDASESFGKPTMNSLDPTNRKQTRKSSCSPTTCS
jgi:histidyl-tRNA synthetase